MSDSWERITSLFGAARALDAPARAAFLDAACGANAQLRQEVERLLADAAQDDSFLAQPAAWALGQPSPAPLSAETSLPRLAVGARFGPYEIVAPLGAGGMGEVYRARDTRLKRDVALKRLLTTVPSGADRLARFQREAEVLAALNHPNIAQIFGLQNVEGVTALVMEFVEGPTLADRIATGPLALDEALTIARQIADALAAAHDQGIVHRDLKPANIKLRDDGTVKVLDFGLAKTMEPVASSSPPSSVSPTLTSPAFTRSGVILGTPAYMAPEQARGRPVDKRADIWAFGAVLFEMLTGRRPFQGESMTDMLAAIVKDEPDIGAAPPQVQRLLRRCLEKDPKKRLKDIGDAWDLIDSGTAATTVRARRTWIAWSVSAGLALAVVVVLATRMQTTPPRPTHLFVQLPEQTVPYFFALSPDGRELAINNTGNLEIRSLDTGELRKLNGTETPRAPFWSPDSRAIGFFSYVERKLKTIPAAGGVAQTLCDNVDASGTATWNRDGTIVFSQNGLLMRTSAAGGACAAITDAEPGVVRRYPVFLPDGEHFMYAQRATDEARTGLFVGSLPDPAGKRILSDFTGALFATSAPGSTRGRLLFGRGQTLMAAAFDAASLTVLSDPTVVADHVSLDADGMIAVSVDASGTLMYLRNGTADRQLAWLDRGGTVVGRPIAVGTTAAAVSLSPDGRRAAFVRESSGRGAVWLHDFQTAQDVFFHSPPAPVVWSPDGQHLAFGATSASASGLFVKSANGGGEQQIMPMDATAAVSDWSRDGRWILYSDRNGSGIWMLPAQNSGTDAPKPIPLVRTAGTDSQAQLSPDGKWLAYTSDETGTHQVYVRPFSPTPPLPEMKWQVSSAVGREPRWRADSHELYYLESAAMAARRFRLTAVPIRGGATPLGAATSLFDVVTLGALPVNNVFVYAPAPDGQRFLVDMTASDAQPTLDVILNWARSEK